MKLQVLKAFWATPLLNSIPCQDQTITWNREHILPRSLFPRSISEAPGNFILLPDRLNSARSNFKYTDSSGGKQILPCKSCPHPETCPLIGYSSPGGFHPPDLFKGLIARSVLTSVRKHSEHAGFVHNRGLDLGVAEAWDSEFPVTKEELLWQRKISGHTK